MYVVSFTVSNIAVATSFSSESNKLLVVCFSDKIVFVSVFFILRLVLMVDCVGGQMRGRLSLPAVLRRDWNSEQCYAAVTVIGPKLVK